MINLIWIDSVPIKYQFTMVNIIESILCMVVDGVLVSLAAVFTYRSAGEMFKFLDRYHGFPSSFPSPKEGKEEGEKEEKFTETKPSYSGYGSDSDEAVVHSLRRSLHTSKQISKNYRDKGISLQKEVQSLKHLVKKGKTLKTENKFLREENLHIKRVLSFQKDLLKQRDEEIKGLEIQLEEEKSLLTEEGTSPTFLRKGYNLLVEGLLTDGDDPRLIEGLHF